MTVQVGYCSNPQQALSLTACGPALSGTDATKFIAGAMQALSAMVKLELPHVNVLTKMDICPDKVWAHQCEACHAVAIPLHPSRPPSALLTSAARSWPSLGIPFWLSVNNYLSLPTLTPPLQRGLEEFLYPDSNQLLARLTASTGPRFRALNRSVAMLLDEFSLVSFVPLDISDEER